MRLPSGALYGNCPAPPTVAPNQVLPMISLNFGNCAPSRRTIAYLSKVALFVAALAASGCSKNTSSEVSTAPGDTVVARVNGVDIKQSDLVLAEEDAGAEMQAASPD